MIVFQLIPVSFIIPTICLPVVFLVHRSIHAKVSHQELLFLFVCLFVFGCYPIIRR